MSPSGWYYKPTTWNHQANMARPPGPDSGRGYRPFRRQAQAAAQSPSRARSEERAGKVLVMTAADNIEYLDRNGYMRCA